MNWKIGVVGIGHIGSAISKRLLHHNYQLYVFDIDEEKKKELASFGAKPVSTLKELVKKVDIVVTSLPNDDILKDVILGKDSIFEHADSQLTLIEISTVLPKTLEEINNYLSQKNINVIDCPISGGPNEAKNGTLSLIVSCKEELFTNYKGLLDIISNNIHYIGEKIGEAKAVKLVNNTMTLGNVLIAASAFSMGTNYGLDPQRLYDVLSKTGGTSHHFVKRFPKVINQDYSSLFPINLGLKDLSLVSEWSNKEGFNTEVTSFLMQYYKEAMESGLGNEDIVAVTKKFIKEKSQV